MKILIISMGLMLLLASCVVAAEDSPTITVGSITFANGKSINYSPKVIVNQNSSRAVRQNERVSVEKQVILVKEWKRLLLEKRSKYFEDQTTEITIYDFDANVLAEGEPFFGEAIILLKTNRILIIQNSSHHQVGESYVLDSNGQKIVSIKHSSNIVLFGKSEDDLTWWIMTSGVESRRPFVETIVYDFNGEKIRQVQHFTKADFNYRYNGVIYTIQSPQPQMPG